MSTRLPRGSVARSSARSLPLLSLLFLSFSSGCAGVATDADGDGEGSAVETAGDAVVAGKETFERPEIGMVWHGGGLCTGTLIRANVVLTAAHCVTGLPKDADATAMQPAYAFEIKVSPTESHRFAVDRVHSLPEASDFDGGQRWRDEDIALLRLATPVPSTLARPMATAPSWPWPGANVAIYGYGCTDRARGEDGRRPGAGVKRTKAYRWSVGLALGWSSTSNECPGDSGGPLIDRDRNVILGTNSGYVGVEDKFGDVPANRAAIEAIATRWSGAR